MSPVLIGILVVVAMLGLIAARCPMALAMAAAGFVGFALIVGFDPALSVLDQGPFDALSNYSFSPIPLFIMMGVFAARSRMSAELFGAARCLFGGWRGGLGLAAVSACGAFSAICGSSLATAASMARVALPEMRKHGYDAALATGTLAAGGTLGIMIPPSIALLLYALITEQSVGDMFAAGLLPGAIGLGLYCVTIAIVVWRRPDLASAGEATSLRQKIVGLKGLLPFGSVFLLIIGGMNGGLFTPTEAAAVGAAATLGIAAARGMGWAGFVSGIQETLAMSAMIFFMIVGAEIFGYLLSVSRIPAAGVEFVAGLGLSKWQILAAILALYLVLGCLMDSIAMLLLTTPVVFPIVVAAGFDPVWFGIVAVVMVELGLITPPVGMNVFVIKAVVPDVGLPDIFRGVLPFVLSDVVRILVLIACPWLTRALI